LLPQQQQQPQQQTPQNPRPRTWWETIFGRNAENREVPIGYNPQQVQALNYLAQLGQSGLGQNAEYISGLRNLMAQNQQNFGIQPIEDKARRDWANETVPTIANRFLAGNTRNSSGFQNALGSAGIDLEAALAGLRNQYGQQQHSNLLQEQGQAFNREGNFMNMLQMGLKPQNEILHVPGDYGIAGEVLPAAINAGTAYATGGALPGVLAGLGSLFGGGQQQQQRNQLQPSVQGAGMFQGRNGLSTQAPNLFEQLGPVNQNQLQPQQLQQVQQQQNQPGQVFSPQSQLDYLQNLVQRLGTPDAQFRDRNKVANNILTSRQNQYQSLTGRGY
jgi:hypothetical protein